MTTGTDDQGAEKPERDFTTLPRAVEVDETVESTDPSLAPDPHAGRNVDQHRALRDD